MLIGFLLMFLPIFKYPHIGVLVWCWTAMIVPAYFLFGFVEAVPFNKVVAVVTLLLWFFRVGPGSIPWSSSTMVWMAVFGILGTISAFNGIGSQESALKEWEKFAKIIVFAFLVTGLITTKARIEALLYAIYLSLGFHGVLEGAKFVASAGGHSVWGPAGSIISDNNHFALAMVAVLPIVFYLYRQAQHRLLKYALIGSSLLVMLSVMGTYSRGGLVGIAALGLFALLRTNKKLKYILAVFPIVVAAIIFAPDKWSNRMDTIATAETDSSFMGRVVAWKLSTLIAMDQPLLGGGFHAVQQFSVWSAYSRKIDQLDFIPTPAPDPYASHAAHSIYFQVLGDMGFLGLIVFLAILASAWRNASMVIEAAKKRPELRWASDLSISLQYSLIAYCVSGASLSMAYFEYIYMIFAMLVILRRIALAKPAQLGKSAWI